jgi:LysM repeat protein
MTLIIGVINREHEEVQYRLEKDVNGEQAEELARIQLAHEEKWEERFRFSLQEPGADQKVSFLLYKDGQKEPYRSVHLWIDVLPRSVPLTSQTPSPTSAPTLVPTSTPAMPATAEASPSVIATAAATSTSTPSLTPSPTTAATAVPTSTPTVSPTAEVSGTPEGRIIHIVQAGETVDAIARQYGVTRDAIVYVNGLEDPSLIYVGQELIIPGPDEVFPTSTPAPP